MWPDNRLTDLLGIKHPIIQAPMAGASTPEMAAAAGNAGCLGSLGCAMMNAKVYQQTHDKTRAMTNAPLNMNFFCHAEPVENSEKNRTAINALEPFYKDLGIENMPDAKPTHFTFGGEVADAVLKSPPAVVSFHFGLPDQGIVDKLKELGVKLLCSATTVEEAKHLEANGIDAIIAQGWEAGGHHGFYIDDADAGIGTMALVPQLVDAVDVPIIAAGGIADGRGIAAAFALGASGIQIGTAFLTSKESAISSIHHDSLMKSSGHNTRVTKGFSGRPARGVINKYMDAIKPIEDELPDFPILNTLSGPLRKISADTNSPDFVAMWSGQGVGMNREIDVSDLIDRLVEETFECFGRLGRGA